MFSLVLSFLFFASDVDSGTPEKASTTQPKQKETPKVDNSPCAKAKTDICNKTEVEQLSVDEFILIGPQVPSGQVVIQPEKQPPLAPKLDADGLIIFQIKF